MPQNIRTTCNRDCPDACSIVATVDQNRVLALKGDPQHPVTRGFLCYRTSKFPERLDSEDRLRTALVRRGGELHAASVDEALDRIAERLHAIRAESGPAAICHYRSGGSLGLLKGVADRFFEHFGPCTVKTGDVCNGAGEAAQLEDFGVSDSNDLFDLRNSRNVVLWGKNPFVSNVHLVPLLKEIRAAGSEVWLVDPVHHKGASLADQRLQPRPGGDLALALGLARLLFERGAIDPQAAERCDGLDGFRALCERQSVTDWAAAAGVDGEQLDALATAFANGPTAILVGWGMQRRRNGGAIVRALDALSAVSGNLYVPGGGCSFYFARRKPFAALGNGKAARTVRETLLGHDLLAARDPAIRALWVTAGNPVSMLPDSASVARAIESLEFTVVVDPFLTETAKRADVVLPCPTMLEDDDLVGAYGHHWIGESRPVVSPPAGVVHEVELFARLAERLGFGEAMAGTIDQWKQRLVEPLAAHGVTLGTLRDGRPVRSPLAAPVLFADGRVATPNGRVRLLQDAPHAFAPPDAFPLWLFSNSTEKSQASQWAGGGLGSHTWVRVHPDAAPAGCAAGDLVEVQSATGSLTAVLEFDPEQRTDVAIVPKGGSFDRGHAANALIAADLTDIGQGAALLDCAVRLRPA